MNAVEFHRVSKSYPVYATPGDRLRELATFGRHRRHDDFHAVRELSFSVRRGEIFCIVGENGSGKSTTLQMIAGILPPTSGEISVAGRVAALLELGSGFNPQFTGRENVYLNGTILGLSRKEIDRRFAVIEDFAEIGDFIDRPVRTYSSGMAMRLAFAVTVNVDPEILLVDEALAVGDAGFRHRCMRRIHELKDRGVTIIFVSHSVADVRAIGERALWLRHGHAREIGDTNDVVAKYLAFMSGAEERETARRTVEPVRSIPNIDHRSGDGGAEIEGIALLDAYGDALQLMVPQSRVTVRITARAKRDLMRPDLGILLRNHLGLDFAGTSIAREGRRLPSITAGETVTVDFDFDIPQLYPGFFSFSPWISEGESDGRVTCDSIDNAITVPMARGEGPVYGYLRVPCRVEMRTSEAPAGSVHA